MRNSGGEILRNFFCKILQNFYFIKISKHYFVTGKIVVRVWKVKAATIIPGHMVLDWNDPRTF